jgi:hypothetical protein
MTHTCDYCNSGKGRAALRDVLQRTPNMTTTRAAQKAGLHRCTAASLRVDLEAHGCIPARAVPGQAQQHVERAAEKSNTQAVKTGGAPLCAIPHWDAALAAEAFGVTLTERPPVVCYPGMRKAA